MLNDGSATTRCGVTESGRSARHAAASPCCTRANATSGSMCTECARDVRHQSRTFVSSCGQCLDPGQAIPAISICPRGITGDLEKEPPMKARALALAALLAVAGTASACGDDSGGGPVELRLGYYPNVTHAQAIVGVDQGIFAKALGSDVKLSTKTFNAGPAAVEALFSDAIDITYIGPGPATNAYAKSKGAAVRVIAGSAANGAALVVKPGITSVEQLRGKKVATPQLGNTQDIALRYYLKEKGLKTDKDGGGDVAIVPQENAQTLETFTSGAIDGAWVPEPWAYRLQEAGGKVLVDERDLWPDKKFVTTHIVVRTKFLKEHP